MCAEVRARHLFDQRPGQILHLKLCSVVQAVEVSRVAALQFFSFDYSLQNLELLSSMDGWEKMRATMDAQMGGEFREVSSPQYHRN